MNYYSVYALCCARTVTSWLLYCFMLSGVHLIYKGAQDRILVIPVFLNRVRLAFDYFSLFSPETFHPFLADVMLLNYLVGYKPGTIFIAGEPLVRQSWHGLMCFSETQDSDCQVQEIFVLLYRWH